MSNEEIFQHRMRLSRLFDMYGGLLTAKQHLCLSLYFDDDLSLSEIGEELEVSRQAVYDLLKRVEQSLEKYESKLSLLAKQEGQQQELHEILELLLQDHNAASTVAASRLKHLLDV